MRGVALATALMLGCSSGAPATAVDAAPTTPTVNAAPAIPPPPPLFPPEIRTLRLRRSIAVRIAPDDAAKPIGTVAYDTRVAWRSAAPGTKDCAPPLRWIEIEPRGWVCEKHLEPSKKEPWGLEFPRLLPGEIVPGAYGKLSTAKSTMVRRVAEVIKGGRTFWKTSEGKLIPLSAIAPYTPSPFTGLLLDEPGAIPLPLAFARHAKTLGAPIDVRPIPDAGAAPIRQLYPRQVVPVLEEQPDWIRVADGAWVARADLRVARVTTAPPTTMPEERWIDVDLDQQTLVAYEGAKPVFVTLVSTGKKKTATTEGIYRVWLKFAETDMNGSMAGEGDYAVATVPWTEFFARDLAFHTAYWHDRFGEPRSHGCVNLSPRDARWLYFFTAPDVPPGWSMAHGVFERPGSAIRIHSAAVPDPPFRGYARRVAEVTLGPLPPLPPDPKDEPAKKAPRDRSAARSP